MKNERHTKEQRHQAALIRRKMIQRDHGDKKTSYKRIKKVSWED